MQQWEVIHDDGDLLVVNKPSGLPVMPGGDFLCHTLTALLQPSGAKPVHRLGRFTSGLQVCARRPETRAKLSAQLRSHGEIRKTYQALTKRTPNLEVGQRLIISSDIVERQHPLLGWIGVLSQALRRVFADAYQRIQRWNFWSDEQTETSLQ